MAIELGTIVEIVTAIPNILNSIATLSSALKIGFGGSKSLWGQMRREIDELRGKLRKFGTLGHFIRDYVMLFGISTDNNNRVDHIIKSMIPYAKNSRMHACMHATILSGEGPFCQKISEKCYISNNEGTTFNPPSF